MIEPQYHSIRISGGSELAFQVAGDPSKPALLLIHGFPSSSRTFRDVFPALAEVAYVIAPDMPGFGRSGLLPVPSFDGIASAIKVLLDHLKVGPRYIYLHDFGAPAALKIAMEAPDAVLGLIIQNANAHETGFGPAWQSTREYWSSPTPENEAGATAHLTAAGMRDQYVAGVPTDIANRISPRSWMRTGALCKCPAVWQPRERLFLTTGPT